MRQQTFLGSGQTYFLILLGIVFLVTFHRANPDGIFTVAGNLSWNTQDSDATKNGNPFLCLYTLEKYNNPTPVTPLARDVLNMPSKYFGKYLRLSGTIKGIQTYPVQNGLPGLLIGNYSELILVAADGTTIIDCLLIGANTDLSIGSNITVSGYTPGLRYVQNVQGAVISELVVIGRLGYL